MASISKREAGPPSGSEPARGGQSDPMARLREERRVLNDLAIALGRSTSFDDIYLGIHDHVSRLMDVGSFIISLFDAETETITAAFVYGEGRIIDPKLLPPLPLEAPGKGTQSQVIRTGQPMIVNDLSGPMADLDVQYEFTAEGEVIPGPPTPEEEKNSTRSELLAPMLHEDDVIGVVALQSHRLDAYGREDMDLLCGIANLAAVAIENRRLVQSLQDSADRLDHALRKTLEITSRVTAMRDPYTSRHHEGVAKLSETVARAMGLDASRVESLRVAALLHDVGKLSVPADLLSKPSVLTPMEMNLVRCHVDASARALTEYPMDGPIAEIVHQHHENLDGTGYPQGLAGDEILLEARILRVADSVEAMTAHRPFRPAFSLEYTMDEIRAFSGSRYDREVVSTCLGLLEDGFRFPGRDDPRV